MAHEWVLNASPLILLGKADLLRMIAPLADTWIVPGGVIREVTAKGPIELLLGGLSHGARVLRVDISEINQSVSGWDL